MSLPRTRAGRPRLKCTDDVLDYWLERSYATAPERESFEYSSMICRNDSLFHYGSHFELARIIRDKRGRTRLILMNGDTYAGASGFGPSTSSRQSDVRRAVGRTSWPALVVPFSALEGAGIDFESIQPIHIREDRWTHEQRSSRERPTKKLAKMLDPSGAMRTETYWDYSTSPYEKREREHEVPVLVDDPNRTIHFSTGHGWCEKGAQRDEDGIWHWQVRRHWLGDSIFRARSTESRTRKATPQELAVAERRREWEAEMNRLQRLGRLLPRSYQRADGLYEDEDKYDYRRMLRLQMATEGLRVATGEHYEAEVARNTVRDGHVPIRVTRWATFLSSFDYQEARPLYFLCELPYGAKPNTTEEAIETLKPPEVVAAEARGLRVVRQGDLFAIPTKLTKRQIRRMRGRQDFTKRLRVLGTNHSVTEGIVVKGGAVLGRGVMRHEPEGWRPPDHAQQRLGDAWHLLVRNTVPRTR